MYTKEFEVRWSDGDANGHMANSAYINFMSHTRMGFLIENGFPLPTLKKHNLGPVVFYEHVHYFKEAFIGENLKVTLEVSGLSDDGTFFKFEHNVYNAKGKHLLFCEIFGGWINTKERKLTGLPEELLKLAIKFPKAESYKTLTKEDTRKFGRKPKDLEA